MSTKKSALVTGGTSGIGKATAERFARDGYTVGVMGRNAKRAEEVVSGIRAAGGSATVLLADVRDRGAMSKQVKRFVDETGGLDAVIAAAGVVYVGATTEMTEEDWNLVMGANLTGTFFLSQLTIDHLCKRKGSFIAIGAAGGTFAAQKLSAYCAAKAALHMFVKSIAIEYAHLGMRANVISPGFVKTPMSDGMLAGISPEELESFRKRTPVGRFSEPEEIADAAAYLCSDRATFANGMVYSLDGGVTAGWYVPA
jgi:NAD(P)-dependent dehydrogenase (short-subunit alcohol dehydrogenase family)